MEGDSFNPERLQSSQLEKRRSPSFDPTREAAKKSEMHPREEAEGSTKIPESSKKSRRELTEADSPLIQSITNDDIKEAVESLIKMNKEVKYEIEKDREFVASTLKEAESHIIKKLGETQGNREEIIRTYLNKNEEQIKKASEIILNHTLRMKKEAKALAGEGNGRAVDTREATLPPPEAPSTSDKDKGHVTIEPGSDTEAQFRQDINQFIEELDRGIQLKDISIRKKWHEKNLATEEINLIRTLLNNTTMTLKNKTIIRNAVRRSNTETRERDKEYMRKKRKNPIYHANERKKENDKRRKAKKAQEGNQPGSSSQPS